MFAKAGKVPRLLPHGPGCRQHSRSHQVLSSRHIQYNSRTKLENNFLVQKPPFTQSCIGCWCVWHCCSHDQQQRGRPKAGRPMQVPVSTCTWCQSTSAVTCYSTICTSPVPVTSSIPDCISRYAPQGKRSWGPTRALAGDITPQQANDYVKVRFPHSGCLQTEVHRCLP